MTDLPARTGQCPNCGGPISFALGSSLLVVCPYCRFAVARTDRDLALLGKVADLVPTASEAAVGDGGEVAGQPFRVAGRVQLDHGRGPWDEWYLALPGERWAWLAKAQGRWYATSPAAIDPREVPPWEQARPGATLTLAGTTWAVAERGESRVLSAEGELPYPTRSGETGRYLDLSGPAGAFGTLDYGDGSEAPRLFAGQVLAPEAVRITDHAVGPRPEHRVDTARLRCPSCGGPIELFVPDRAERATCPSCSAFLDVAHGELKYLRHLDPPPFARRIPVGTRGTLRGVSMLCIGSMIRSVYEDGEHFAWTEYLFHTPAGYRWLTEDAQGHFHVFAPIEIAEVSVHGRRARYAGRDYRLFTSGSAGTATVEWVQGEFYWRVEVGDEARLDDYIAPPYALGLERTEGEVNASAGEYVPVREVWAAFGLPGAAREPYGVGMAQPAPSARPAIIVGLVLVALLAGIEIAVMAAQSPRVVWEGDLPVRASPAAPPGMPAPIPMPGTEPVVFTPPFEVTERRTTIGVQVVSSGSNDWVGVAVALIDPAGGIMRETDAIAEHYTGVTDGESWSEGDAAPTAYFDQIPRGTYVVRMETAWEAVGIPAHTPPRVTARVRVDDDPMFCCTPCVVVLLIFPAGWALTRRSRFEKRRWASSNV